MKYSVVEWIILCVVLTFIVAMFSACPIYYYATEYSKDSQDMETMIYLDFNETTQLCNGSNSSTESVTLCNIYGIADMLSGCSSIDGCNAETYTGSVCEESLLAWQDCSITSMDDTLFISPSKEQTESENDAETFVSYLGLASKECQAAVLPFFCLYTFPICDCATTRLYQPTRESCELIRDETCSSEWLLVNSVNPDILPDCNKLPNARAESINGSSTGCFNETNGTSTDEQNFTCRYDFIEQNNACWPRCDEFRQYPAVLSKIIDYIILVAGILGVLMACAVIVIGIFDYRRIFVFPVIYVMFLMIDYLFIGVVTIISVIGRDSLMCSDIRLDKSRENPSVFCTLTGITLHYGIGQMCVWWFCHVSIFSYHVLFPFHSRTMKNTKKMKAIYFFTLVAGFLVPLPAILANFIDKDLRILQTDYPTTACTTGSYAVWFYTYTLPGSFALGFGSVLLVVVIWNVHKHQGLFKEKKKRKLTMISVTSAEKRIIIIFLGFLVYGLLFSVYSTVIGSTREEITANLEKYFNCELLGHEPGKCDRSEIEYLYLAYLKIFAYSSLSFLPLCTLNFVLNWKKLKQCSNKGKDIQSRRTSQSSLTQRKISVPNFKVMTTILEESGCDKDTELIDTDIK